MSEATRCRLMEKGWKYTSASETNLAALFKRIRSEQKKTESPKPSNVKTLPRKAAK